MRLTLAVLIGLDTSLSSRLISLFSYGLRWVVLSVFVSLSHFVVLIFGSSPLACWCILILRGSLVWIKILSKFKQKLDLLSIKCNCLIADQIIRSNLPLFSFDNGLSVRQALQIIDWFGPSNYDYLAKFFSNPSFYLWRLIQRKVLYQSSLRRSD